MKVTAARRVRVVNSRYDVLDVETVFVFTQRGPGRSCAVRVARSARGGQTRLLTPRLFDEPSAAMAEARKNPLRAVPVSDWLTLDVDADTSPAAPAAALAPVLEAAFDAAWVTSWSGGLDWLARANAQTGPDACDRRYIVPLPQLGQLSTLMPYGAELARTVARHPHVEIALPGTGLPVTVALLPDPVAAWAQTNVRSLLPQRPRLGLAVPAATDSSFALETDTVETLRVAASLFDPTQPGAGSTLHGALEMARLVLTPAPAG